MEEHIPATRLGENGSVIIKNNTSKTLYIQNTQRWVPENANSFEEWFPDIERVIVCSSTSIDPECVNGTNAILSLDTINKNTLDQGVPWVIKLQNMYIDSNSEIKLSELGYLGSTTAANGLDLEEEEEVQGFLQVDQEEVMEEREAMD
jgi:hypothetical protein